MSGKLTNSASIASVLEKLIKHANAVHDAKETEALGQYAAIRDVVRGVSDGAYDATTRVDPKSLEPDPNGVDIGTAFATQWRAINPVADSSFSVLRSQFKTPVDCATKHGGAVVGNLLDTTFEKDSGEYDKYRQSHPVVSRFAAAVNICRAFYKVEKGKKFGPKAIQAVISSARQPAAERTPLQKASAVASTLKTLVKGTKSRPAVLEGALWLAALRAVDTAITAMPRENETTIVRAATNGTKNAPSANLAAKNRAATVQQLAALGTKRQAGNGTRRSK